MIALFAILGVLAFVAHMHAIENANTKAAIFWALFVFMLVIIGYRIMG